MTKKWKNGLRVGHVCLSNHPPNNSDWTGCWNFMKFGIGVLYKTLSSKYEFHENQHSDSHTLLEGLIKFSHYSLRFGRLSKNCKRRLFASSYLPVRLSEWNNSALTERTFVKFDIWEFPENLSRKFMFHENLTWITATLCEYVSRSMTISRWIFLEWKLFRTKLVLKVIKHILCSITLFPDNRSVYEICGKIWCSQTSYRLHNTAHALCMLNN